MKDLKFSERCLVLGAGGFIGTNLCLALGSKVGVINAFGRKTKYSESLKGINWFGGDFGDPAAVSKAVEGCDLVYHLINSGTPATSNINKLADLNINVGSTIQLLDMCKEAGVKRIIFISSGGAIYGDHKFLPISEDAATNPINAYGISKLSIEKYLALYERLHGMDHKILRVSNPFGPYQLASKNQGLVAAIIDKALKDEPVSVWGDGTTIRDYLYVDDVVSALMKCAEYDGAGKVFNIGSGVGTSIIDLIHKIEILLRKKIKVQFSESRIVDVSANTLNTSFAKKELGWSCNTSLSEGLSQTIAWSRDAIL